MNKATRPVVLLLFGGSSAEHEVSVRSAANVAAAIDGDKYDLRLAGIDKKGRWVLIDDPGFFGKHAVVSYRREKELFLPPDGSRTLWSLFDRKPFCTVDVVFPLIHGTFGEDGTLQGLLQLAGVPFVGSGVLSSAVCMDKDFTKRMLRDAGVAVGRFLVFRFCDNRDFRAIREELGFPLFVKPANLGSSVGISRVNDEKELARAMERAFRYDTKILVEEAITGREIECAVLGNETPVASVSGEIVPANGFYSYEAKYIDEKGARLVIPAQVSEQDEGRIKSLAVRSYEVLGCEGLARVDCFLLPDGGLLVNEVNTLPGFTSISMYPKLFEASGVGARELTDRLIRFGIERHERQKKLIRAFEVPGE
ncbi:MAG: D-alanine--D-alanine ligase [Spirochaetes bacterium]|nr:D-alanine--D-alanine ligase [Spirochaetota bacterium]